MKPVSLVLAGIGGMGGVYVEELLKHEDEGRFLVAGLVDPEPGRCRQLGELTGRGLPVFTRLEDFYASGRTADLAVISSPHQFHAAQTVLALERGSYVLCEKPTAGTIGEARVMAVAEKRPGRWAAIAYQWSFSAAVQAAKADILAGVYGRPRRARCLYTWPRDKAYYGRNGWAGRIRLDDGSWVLDGPANNAMAHDLHNMLYLLGPDVRAAARPVSIQAELYRAYPIENYDTAAARIGLEDGTPLMFWFSHAAGLDRGPRLRMAFEQGVLAADRRGGGLGGELADGAVRAYGDPDLTPMKKLWDAVGGAAGGPKPVCCVEAASAQTLAVNGMQAGAEAIVDFPARMKREEPCGGSSRIWVEGLDEALEAGFESGRLPSEIGTIEWARPGRAVDLADLEFPG